MPNKKVLIVTYYWPPAGGAAVFRVLKFTKYLRKNGWEPFILTVNNPESSQFDLSLITQIPDDLNVQKTSSFEPSKWISRINASGAQKTPVGAALQTSDASFFKRLITNIRLNYFVPDAKIGWIPFATREGLKIIKEHKPDIIFSTSPPPTVHLIANDLSQKTGLPWVADFRDPWTNIYYYDDNQINKKAIDKNLSLEDKVLSKASAITVVNHGFFSNNYLSLLNDKSTRITNGFDADDLPQIEKNKTDSFVIRYLGHFKNNQFPTALVEALNQLATEVPSKKLILEFIGYVDPGNKAALSDVNEKITIQFKEFVPRNEAMKLMASADALMMSIGGNQEKKYGLSLKLFDYIMHQKPILGFGPVDGDAASILKETNLGKMFAYEDVPGVSAFLKSLLSSDFDLQPNEANIQKYNVKNLTNTLISVFKSVIKK